MQRIKVNESVAARRRVPLQLKDDAGAPWDGTVTGIKPDISIGGAALAAATNDIVKLAAGACYIELTQPETLTVGPIFISIVDTDLAHLFKEVAVVSVDPYAGAVVTAGGQQGVISF